VLLHRLGTKSSKSAAILVVGLLMIHYSVEDVAFSVCEL